MTLVSFYTYESRVLRRGDQQPPAADCSAFFFDHRVVVNVSDPKNHQNKHQQKQQVHKVEDKLVDDHEDWEVVCFQERKLVSMRILLFGVEGTQTNLSCMHWQKPVHPWEKAA